MVNTRELRLGNYISFKGKSHRVEGIVLYGVNIGIIYDKSTNYEDKEFDPIPLTPEILEAAGLNQTFPEENVWQVAVFQFKFSDAGLSLLDDERELFFGSKPFMYLHQLQNLYFSLTGEELQIMQRV
jgi:hypothetical protein